MSINDPIFTAQEYAIGSTASVFSAIDLSKMDKPELLKPVDVELLIKDLVADFRRRDPYQYADILESDPAAKLLEDYAYRLKHEIDNVNHKAAMLCLAWAQGDALDHIGMTYCFGARRLVVTEQNLAASPPQALVLESDDAFRRRLSLFPESITTAGSTGSYLYHALSADGRVADASVISPYPGTTLVSVLAQSRVYPDVADFSADAWRDVSSGLWGVCVTFDLTALNQNTGLADADLLAKVRVALNHEHRRPLSEEVLVDAVKITSYDLKIDMYTYTGVGRAQVMQAAMTQLLQYVQAHFKPEHDINESGIKAAAHGVGVQRVVVVSPTPDLINGPTQAARCDSITINFVGEAL